MKKKVVFIVIIISMFLVCVACGDSSKKQKIIVYDYLENTEKEYDSSNIEINEFINDVSDYLMDEQSVNIEIPSSAVEYKKITLFQLSKEIEEYMLEIEILKDNDKFYCKANFIIYPETTYRVELPESLVKTIKIIWI